VRNAIIFEVPLALLVAVCMLCAVAVVELHLAVGRHPFRAFRIAFCDLKRSGSHAHAMQAATSARPSAAPALARQRLPQRRAQQLLRTVPKVRRSTEAAAPGCGGLGHRSSFHLTLPFRRCRPHPGFLQATSSDVQQWLSQGLITDQEAKRWVQPCSGMHCAAAQAAVAAGAPCLSVQTC